MEQYIVTGFKATKVGWETAPPILEPTTVLASDSYDAALKVAKEYFGKPVKLFGKVRPNGVLGVFFETRTYPNKLVLHVEDTDTLRPARGKY